MCARQKLSADGIVKFGSLLRIKQVGVKDRDGSAPGIVRMLHDPFQVAASPRSVEVMQGRFAHFLQFGNIEHHAVRREMATNQPRHATVGWLCFVYLRYYRIYWNGRSINSGYKSLQRCTSSTIRPYNASGN